MREERLVTNEMVRLPQREQDSHKGDYGKLLIVAGSEGYTGAPVFAAEGALCSGAGLVYLGVPRDVYPIVAAQCSSAMPFPLPDDTEQLVERARSCDVVLAGPGMGRSPQAQQLVFRLMEEVEGPLVLDADGVTAEVDGEEVPVTTREFNILYKLLSYPKKTFTRAQLMDEFWGVDSEASLRAVDVYITKLRDKFSACDGFEIKTVRGLGYKAVLK